MWCQLVPLPPIDPKQINHCFFKVIWFKLNICMYHTCMSPSMHYRQDEWQYFSTQHILSSFNTSDTSFAVAGTSWRSKPPEALCKTQSFCFIWQLAGNILTGSVRKSCKSLLWLTGKPLAWQQGIDWLSHIEKVLNSYAHCVAHVVKTRTVWIWDTQFEIGTIPDKLVSHRALHYIKGHRFYTA